MFSRIYWRVILGHVTVIVLVALLLSAYLQRAFREDHLENTENYLATKARIVATIVEDAIAAGRADELAAIARRQGDLTGSHITIIASDGTVLGGSRLEPHIPESAVELPEIRGALADGIGSDSRWSSVDGYTSLHVAVPFPSTGQPQGVVRISLPMVQIDDRLSTIGRSLLVAAAIASLLALLPSMLLARSVTRPVVKLTEMARLMSEGHLDQRIRVETRDEVGVLAEALNDLAGQLASTINTISEERNTLAAMLASMADGILVVDEHEMVRMANPAAERILQASFDRLVGHSFAEVAHDHELVQLLRDCLAASDSGSCSLTINLGLPRRHVRAIATPLGSRRALLVLQDLTEFRRVDWIRRDFIANVSHELRTPLASMKALVETLQAGALEDPPAAREFLERMEVEVDGLTQLVQELLELSRMESGQSQLRVERTYVRELLDSVAERMLTQAERAGLQLSVDVPADLPPVRVDRQRLWHALINLVHNAIKFTPPNGKVRLLAQQARVREDGTFAFRQPGNENTAGQHVPLSSTHVVVSVVDTGVGIPAEDLPRIFERFYKADKARSGGGTGLGLAIARHSVEAHGGRIWAESVEGQGATFRIALPLANPDSRVTRTNT